MLVLDLEYMTSSFPEESPCSWVLLLIFCRWELWATRKLVLWET